MRITNIKILSCREKKARTKGDASIQVWTADKLLSTAHAGS